MDNLPSTLTDALEALAAARADLGALNALNAEHSALVAQHQTTVAQLAELGSAHAALEQRALELATQVDDYKRRETDSAAKANAIVANLGVPPVAIQAEQASQPKTKAELWAHYNTLGFAERNEFYKQNKAVMSGK